jgi:hypothetical protein
MSFPVFDGALSFEALHHEFESIKAMDAYRTALEDVSSEIL